MLKLLILNFLKAIRALLYRKVEIECDSIPYEFSRVPLKKIINWTLVEASVFFKAKRPWGWPTHAQIEPTNFCNLKCALCPVTEGLKRPSQHMDFATFKKFIDETLDYLFLIILWDWGEPFLNPKVYEMISYAKEKNIKIVSSTNGHIFAKGDHGEQVVRSGLDSLIFAVDGTSQNTYERYRKGGELNKVMAGIKKVVAAKKALQSNTPFINLRFIAMKHNEHEIAQLHEFARSLEVDAVTLKTLNPHGDGRIIANEEYGNEFIPENPGYRRFKYDPKTHARIRRRLNPCKDLWNSPALHSDGKVCLCTFDTNSEYVFGDITKQSFKEIWKGDLYLSLRRKFRNNYQQIPICSDCTFAFEGGTCNTETIAKTHFFMSSTQKVA
ncbi:MAG: radical SAM/SPASM domain-containing protein [Nitrospinales bacterium]